MALLSKASLNTLDYVFGGAPFCDQIVANVTDGSLDVVSRGVPFSSFATYPIPSLLISTTTQQTLDVVFNGKPFCEIEVKGLQSRSLDTVFNGVPAVLTYQTTGYVRADIDFAYVLKNSIQKSLVASYLVNVAAPSAAPTGLTSSVNGLNSDISWSAVSGATSYDIEWQLI